MFTEYFHNIISLHKFLQKINQIHVNIESSKDISFQNVFFPTHLLHSPGRLQTLIQSWKQKYSDQALLSTHVHIWNSHIETPQSLTYTFLLPFNAMPALKDKKGNTFYPTQPPLTKKKITSNPSSYFPEIDLQNLQTFLNGKNFSHNVGGYFLDFQLLPGVSSLLESMVWS